MDKKTLDELKNYVADICDINEENLDEKLRENAKRYNQIFHQFAYECNELNKIEREMKEEYGRLYKHFKYEDDHTWDSKGEIESQIFADKKYSALTLKHNEQTYVVKQLEGCLNNIKHTSFQIKNLISLLKFRSGMF